MPRGDFDEHQRAAWLEPETHDRTLRGLPQPPPRTAPKQQPAPVEPELTRVEALLLELLLADVPLGTIEAAVDRARYRSMRRADLVPWAKAAAVKLRP